MRSEILSYLEEIRSHYSAYHNHKEASGWAAVAVFLGYISQFFGLLFRNEINFPEEKRFVVLVIGVVVIVVSLYLKEQFRLSRIAANNVAATFYLKTQLIGNPKHKIASGAYGLRPSADPKTHYSYVLPRTILEMSDEFKNKGTGAKTALEWLAYAMVWVPLAAVVYLLWPLW